MRCDRCNNEEAKHNVTISHPAMTDNDSRAGVRTFNKNVCDGCNDWLRVNWPAGFYFRNGMAVVLT